MTVNWLGFTASHLGGHTTGIATNRWHSHDGTSSTQCSEFVRVSSLQPPMNTWLSAGGVQVARKSTAWQVVRTTHAASFTPFHHRNTQLFLHSLQRFDDAAPFSTIIRA